MRYRSCWEQYDVDKCCFLHLGSLLPASLVSPAPMFIDAAYVIRGAIMDGLEQSDLPALISQIKSEKEYWGLEAELDALQEMMTGGSSN